MDCEVMMSTFDFNCFFDLTKQEAKEYFEWYIGEKDHRIELLQTYILNCGENMKFDFKPESLVPLWKWLFSVK